MNDLIISITFILVGVIGSVGLVYLLWLGHRNGEHLTKPNDPISWILVTFAVFSVGFNIMFAFYTGIDIIMKY